MTHTIHPKQLEAVARGIAKENLQKTHSTAYLDEWVERWWKAYLPESQAAILAMWEWLPIEETNE